MPTGQIIRHFFGIYLREGNGCGSREQTNLCFKPCLCSYWVKHTGASLQVSSPRYQILHLEHRGFGPVYSAFVLQVQLDGTSGTAVTFRHNPVIRVQRLWIYGTMDVLYGEKWFDPVRRTSGLMWNWWWTWSLSSWSVLTTRLLTGKGKNTWVFGKTP